VAALAQVVAGDQLQLTAGVFSLDGQQAIRGTRIGTLPEAVELGRELSEELKVAGATLLIAAARR
jgi:porphobilinogen deaminase